MSLCAGAPDGAAGRAYVLLAVSDNGVGMDARRPRRRRAATKRCWPEEALAICTQHPGLIHLLLTDMVMPRMRGRDLAGRAAWLRSDMKVLFMSGYTEDLKFLGGEGPGPTFLKKPFTPTALARKIREALDE